MALEQILSVSGKSGLFRLVGQMKNGIIVESLDDGKRFPVHGTAKVSALEEISIYTESDEVPLKDIFTRIYEKEGGKEAMSHKEPMDKIKAYFEEIVPDYDRDRVYSSDMAKVIRWYNQLIEHNAFSPEEEAKEEAKEESDGKEEKKEKKPAKSAAKKASTSASKAKAAPKKAAANTKVTAPRKSGGSQRGS